MLPCPFRHFSYPACPPLIHYSPPFFSPFQEPGSFVWVKFQRVALEITFLFRLDHETTAITGRYTHYSRTFVCWSV